MTLRARVPVELVNQMNAVSWGLFDSWEQISLGDSKSVKYFKALFVKDIKL